MPVDSFFSRFSLHWTWRLVIAVLLFIQFSIGYGAMYRRTDEYGLPDIVVVDVVIVAFLLPNQLFESEICVTIFYVFCGRRASTMSDRLRP